MSKLVKLVVFLTLLGVAKAAHKLILLAAIGLATLMMLHVLAQDYNKINKRPAMMKSYLFKRSIHEHTQEIFNIDWETVLSKDHIGCTRSFICQIIAQPKKDLQKEERNIFELVEYSLINPKSSNDGLKSVIKQAESLKSSSDCLDVYKLCPYSNDIMLSLLRRLYT